MVIPTSPATVVRLDANFAWLPHHHSALRLQLGKSFAVKQHDAPLRGPIELQQAFVL